MEATEKVGKQNRLRVVLAEKRIKQKDLVEQIGLDKTTLSELVNEKREPTLATARKIARALNMEIGEIWPEED